MEIFLMLVGFVLLIWLIGRIGRWVSDESATIYWPYPVIGSQDQMMDEVAIMRENQKDAIAARKLARRYETQMRREQGEGQRRALAISQAYVRKVQEITRRRK